MLVKSYTALLSALATATLSLALPAAAQLTATEQPDKYTWLEDIHGDKQIAWVKAEDARTAAVIEKDPRFAQFQADALKVLNSPERLPDPMQNGRSVYNLWRDAAHVRGILRRTTLENYTKPDPGWQTVLDIDQLAKDENKSWVWHGVNCLTGSEEYCLVYLSEGGEDASTVREFNLKTGKFVEGGFVLPRDKNRIGWLDKDTLLVARNWGPGTMSDSGYPITVRAWKRGQPLERAKEVFRAGHGDNGGAAGFALRDGKGNRAVILVAGPDIENHRWYIFLADGARQLGLPPRSEASGLVDGQLIFTVEEDWTPKGGQTTYRAGTVISLDLKAVKRDAEHLKPSIMFAPTPTEFVQDMATSPNRVILTTLANVKGRAYVCAHNSDGKWTRTQLPVPDNQAVEIEDVGSIDDHFFLSVQGFLTPPSLWLGDGATGSFAKVKEQPPLFDASGLTVEQLEATSKDGTRVPYFVVHRNAMPYDGNNPTLLTAYGGFQISETPEYKATIGKLWLERGGVYVSANIRGGGEFGPAWHEAGLKTHRQRIYDDFYAVAQDLEARKITSQRRLGILGGSNGGLLMGVEFTQHPEMWNAVVIARPLLDMLAYEHLSAGASWVGEYGSVSVPEERAFLASISPYNQLKPGVKYPEPLINTSTNDDRVGPVQARKFAARLEEFHDPFFFDEVIEGGHSVGADNVQEAHTWAEFFTYLTMKLMD
jgi:prolyl oligopeptidase